MKRWVDDGTIAAERTAGGHRRIPLAAAVGFMRRHRISPQWPGAFSRAAPPALGAVDSGAVDACHEALLNDNAERALAIIIGRYISGADIAMIGDGLIRPALARLGEIWNCDSHGILIEHRAVDTCMRALSDLLGWLPPAPPGAPVAITAAGPGDPYMLPPLLASMTLLERGIHARNLGPSTPLETVALAVARYRASMCSISVSIAQDRKHHVEWIRLGERLESGRTRIVVGGRCVSTLSSEIRKRIHVCASLAELGAYAAGVVHGVGPGLNLARGNEP